MLTQNSYAGASQSTDKLCPRIKASELEAYTKTSIDHYYVCGVPMTENGMWTLCMVTENFVLGKESEP